MTAYNDASLTEYPVDTGRDRHRGIYSLPQANSTRLSPAILSRLPTLASLRSQLPCWLSEAGEVGTKL